MVPVPSPWTLGPNITRRRRNACLTQQELADLLSVSRQTVNRWENGQSMPGRRHLVALARVFRTSTARLFEKRRLT